jgi:hypothetical protein
MEEEKVKGVKDKKLVIECPRCHKRFAELTYGYDTCIEPEDVKVLEGKKVYDKNDDFCCTYCSYPMTNWDIMLALAANLKGETDEIK